MCRENKLEKKLSPTLLIVSCHELEKQFPPAYNSYVRGPSPTVRNYNTPPNLQLVALVVV